MGFLDQLRMNNIFPRKSPLGMPEIDTSTIGDTLNEVLPFARTSDNEDSQRTKDMMSFQHGLNNPQPQLSMRDRAIGDTTQRPMMRGGGVQGGFSPMQQQFQARDKADRARQQEQSDMSTKFQQAMQLQAMKGSQDIDLEDVRSASNTADIEQRGGIDQRAAALLAENQRGVASTKTAADIEAARALQSGKERGMMIEGVQNRLTNSVKPPTSAAANDPAKQFASRAQSLAIDAPALATMLVPPTESGGQFTISPKATPDQIAAIRKYMMGQQAAPAKPKSKVVTSPSKASIVDRTNQVSRR